MDPTRLPTVVMGNVSYPLTQPLAIGTTSMGISTNLLVHPSWNPTTPIGSPNWTSTGARTSGIDIVERLMNAPQGAPTSPTGHIRSYFMRFIWTPGNVANPLQQYTETGTPAGAYPLVAGFAQAGIWGVAPSVPAPQATFNVGTKFMTVNYGTSSDYRLKGNVAPITNGLDVVRALKPRVWDYDAPENGMTGAGFLAHEVQEAITGAGHSQPDFVAGSKDGGDKYGTITEAPGDLRVDSEGNPVIVRLSYLTEEEEQAIANNTITFNEQGIVPDYQSMDYGKMTTWAIAGLKGAIELIDQQAEDIAKIKTAVTLLANNAGVTVTL